MSISSTRVVIALSGGVDSSVAAYLLKDKGYDVLGVFMKNWHDESVTISNECPWVEDSYDAMIVAEKLSIPFQSVDLSKEYQARIIDYMFEEYKNGNTPNPDILCNREIKFDVFLKVAESLGADYLATGHYSIVNSETKNEKTIYKLISGKDSNKDQSYFLCQLTQKQLSKVIFPIGKLTKKEVREIAKKNKLVTAEKKDSQGLCFVGKVSLPDFLQQKLKKKKGNVIEIPSDSKLYDKTSNFINENERMKSLSDQIVYSLSDGKIIGNHNGAHYYTIGQRKGIGVGGQEKPLYVKEVNKKQNYIVLAPYEKLQKNKVFFKNVSSTFRFLFHQFGFGKLLQQEGQIFFHHLHDLLRQL